MKDPYKGRHPTLKPLREATRQPGDEKLQKVAKGGRGDVTNSYLSGKAGGEAHPYYDQRSKRR